LRIQGHIILPSIHTESAVTQIGLPLCQLLRDRLIQSAQNTSSIFYATDRAVVNQCPDLLTTATSHSEWIVSSSCFFIDAANDAFIRQFHMSLRLQKMEFLHPDPVGHACTSRLQPPAGSVGGRFFSTISSNLSRRREAGASAPPPPTSVGRGQQVLVHHLLLVDEVGGLGDQHHQ